jgi:hypothetical protein
MSRMGGLLEGGGLIGQGVPSSQTAATPDWFERLTDWRTIDIARMLEQPVSLRA